MPPGGDGFYYFSAYFLVDGGDYALFDIVINAEALLCTAQANNQATPLDLGQAACSAATYATEGFEPHIK